MADDRIESRNGNITSNTVVSSNSREPKAPNKTVLGAIGVLLVVIGLVCGVRIYNESYRRTTAKSAEQVIHRLEKSISGGRSTKADGNVLSAYQPKGLGFSVKPDKAQSISYKLTLENMPKTYKKTQRLLGLQGLSGRVISSSQTGTTPAMYYENAFVRCTLLTAQSGSEHEVQVSCADMSAYVGSVKKVQQFYELYAKENPEKTKILGMSGIDIEDSLTTGYKTGETTIIQDYTTEGAVSALYYQTPDGVWHFFKATQLEILCNEYNTLELKKAFIGKECYEADFAISNVRL